MYLSPSSSLDASRLSQERITGTERLCVSVNSMAAPISESSNTQYDTFAEAYSNITKLPGEILTANLLSRGLGDISDLNVLDLACGSGFYSRVAVGLGAKSITGVDISSEMLRIGQRIEEETQSSSGKPSRIVYHKADCSQPLDRIGLQPASFDLIMANWLFNYSSNRAELEDMWRNVSRYLKAGGRFVGVGELHELELALNRSEWAGIRGGIIGQTEDATKVHIELLSEPKVDLMSSSSSPAMLIEMCPWKSV